MKPFVTAVVVANGDSDFLQVTLSALAAQTRQPNQTFVVDTSSESNLELLSSTPGAKLLRSPNARSLAAPFQAAINESANDFPASESPEHWLWLLHDDSAPTRTALEELLNVIEISPSVALIGPKLLDWNDPRHIQQLGLTLTKSGAIFSPVMGELDQAQHDAIDDVLAVSTAGMLIKADVYQEVKGFDSHAPNLAADIDLSIRVRLAGHRVAVAPLAKVAHASLALNGKRPRRWLRSSPRTALRRATAHLKIAYSPILTALLYLLFAPVIGIVRAVWQVATKHPNRIWAEVSTGFWLFFTGFARLASRRKRSGLGPVSVIDALRASRQQVRQARLNRLQEDDLEVFGSAAPLQPEGAADSAPRAASGLAFWFAFGLLLISWRFIPTNAAAIGGGLLPLSSDWYALFTHAGASYQNIGLGFFGPSDPFNWVLLGIGSLTPWQPSLALALLLLLAKPLAFLGAWRSLGLVTARNWLRILGALAFAFWPAFSAASLEGRAPAVITTVALPWLVLAVARAAGMGKDAPRRSAAKTWSWIGVAGLLLMVVGASSPNIVPALVVAMIVVLFSRLKKFRYLFWLPLPVGAALAPLVWFEVVGLLHPLATLADPGLPQRSNLAAFWQLLLGQGVSDPISGSASSSLLSAFSQVVSWVPTLVVLLAVIALLSRRFVFATSLWLLVMLAVASAWLVERLDFAAIGVGSSQVAVERVNGTPHGLLALAAIGLIALAVLALDQIEKPALRRGLAAALTVVSIVPLVTAFALSRPQFHFTDGRVVPSIVAAEAERGSQLKTLVIRDVTGQDVERRYAAELVSGDGVQLDDVSSAYRFALAGLSKQRSEYATAGQLVADLTAANGTDLKSALQDLGIGFVLSPDSQSRGGRALATALDSASELEAAGATEYGRLWRVKSPNPELEQAPTSTPSPWSITKVVQLVVILGFVLLAIPGRSVSARRRDSEIFAGQTDEPTGGDDFV